MLRLSVKAGESLIIDRRMEMEVDRRCNLFLNGDEDFSVLRSSFVGKLLYGGLIVQRSSKHGRWTVMGNQKEPLWRAGTLLEAFRFVDKYQAQATAEGGVS